ncbi:MAG: DMT family transporter [Muribaculaceae bacterium]|nr:DMT family transporter [Muribaculaceae bacterium]MBQ4138758.1 DMT family transporter [Muribaculaceae bacterium]
MWIAFALISSLSLGFYDVVKKVALKDNNVFFVLFLNTLLCTLFMSPFLVGTATDATSNFVKPMNHVLIFIKSVIVTSSWLLGYFAIKHLPLTIQSSINAFRPILVLVGAILIFGESLNALQWIGIVLGFFSLLWVGFIGRREGFSIRKNKWIWAGLISVVLWAISGLYDKYLMTRFKPINVEAWYSFYQLVIMSVVMLLTWKGLKKRENYEWRWSILLISVFICIADLSYFFALSEPDSLVSIASMLRRGSALVAFFYGIFVLKEKDVKLKIIDQCILIAGVIFMILGSI